MKSHIQNLLVALAIFACASHVAAQGTVFTYQGQLMASGVPANGTYDLTFDLYDASTNGNQLGSTFLAVPVTNGLFTVSLDFGAQFSGAPRWLQITVQLPGERSFTTLSPLQEIFPTPYAIMANSASNLLGTLPASQIAGAISNSALPSNPNVPGTITANNFSGNGNSLTNLNASQLTGTVSTNQLPPNVAYLDAAQTFTGPDIFTRSLVIDGSLGIGVTNPPSSLQIAGGVLARGGSPGPYGINNNGYAFLGNNGDDDSGMFSSADGQIEFYNNNSEAMRIQTGNVGIGITNPIVPLQVNGTVMLGSGGTNYAPSTQENVRIVRGIITANMTVYAGAGFTVVSNAVGVCTITFTPPFSNIPVVTCSSFNAQSVPAGINPTAVQINTYNLGSTTLVNQYFNFIAIGPP